MTKQWHPTFARLLRPILEEHYEVQATVPVGDAPREADVVLLRRTTTGALPYRGLWRHLTTWNVLEFKGPTVSPREGDLDLLLELGLGIHRRLNEQRHRDRQPLMGPEGVSFWYLANHLGRRFRKHAREVLGEVEQLEPGVWRCTALRRLVFLVSSTDVPVEVDSLPLHLVSKEPLQREREVAQLLTKQKRLWEQYVGWLATLHPALWEEVRTMAKKAGKGFGIHLLPVIEDLGIKNVIEQVGIERVINEVGIERVINEVGIERVINEVGIERVIEVVGLERLIEKAGVEKVVETVGWERLVKSKGVADLFAKLTPAQRRELKQLLQES
jgi:hypothetical protein